jgi:hypothetical protein
VSDGPNPLASIPSTWAQFGTGLRQLRTISLRAVEHQQQVNPAGIVLSRSQLHRYEAGASRPKLAFADHLDELYGAGGWVSLAMRSLYGAIWDPWHEAHGVARTHHAHKWPALYDGLVWIAIKPLPERVGQDHELTLAWGPWQLELTLSLPASGVVLVTGKAEDPSAEAVTLNLDCAVPVFSLRGAGPAPAGTKVIDIRGRWRHMNIESREGRPRLRELGRGPRQIESALPRARRRRRRTAT